MVRDGKRRLGGVVSDLVTVLPVVVLGPGTGRGIRERVWGRGAGNQQQQIEV